MSKKNIKFELSDRYIKGMRVGYCSDEDYDKYVKELEKKQKTSKSILVKRLMINDYIILPISKKN